MADKPWLRVWPRGVPVSIPHPRIPLHKILEETAERHPQKSAITYLEREITYGKLNSLSDQFAAGLQTLGVKRGDRVAIFLPNIPQFIFGYYGTIKAGAVLTAISPLHRDREVKYQLKDSEAETILTLDTLYPIVDRIKQTTKLKNVILTGKEKYEPELPSSTLDKTAGPRIVPLPELLNKNTIESPVANVNPKETLVALQYTGGTTGRAKGAMLTHTNLVSNTLMFATWIKGTQAKEVFLVALPLFHIYGMTTSMNVPIKLAAKMILLPRFDQKKVFESIQNHKVTIFCGVPTMYTALVSNPEISKFNLSSIRVCISGASPLP
ncbi:AMP-binding protein, partial [Candidatus Bathyarchaeota archaeon]|nr:AMP-binding protein [Candidatus Bathyarchaeota archaeon]